MMMTDLIFKRFTVGGYGINGFLVADPETRIGVFIDPGGFNAEIEAFIENRQIVLNHLFLRMAIGTIPKACRSLRDATRSRAMPAREKSVLLNISYRVVR